MKYLIESYGCQLNIAESNALELLLKGQGLVKTDQVSQADAVILNTCSVRKSAENRIWGRLSLFGAEKKRRKNLKIVVTGCMAERLQDELLLDAPFVDKVVGTIDKLKIVSYLVNNKLEHDDSYTFTSSYYKEGEIASYVPIMNGCNNFCTFCIVPHVRGRELSRPVEDIIKEVKHLESLGVKEIMLLGQNVNSYNYKGMRFPDLLTEVCRNVDKIRYIRFDSPHPKDFSPELIEVIRNEEKVAKHIHLPMQSGSSRILQLMNRRTTREKFKALVDNIRTIEGVTFATDVMVAFPTESEEDYLDTLTMMDYMTPIEAFMYFYNKREGTPAATMAGQVEDKVKSQRLDRLIKEQLARCKAYKQTRVGLTTDAIVTGITRDDKSKFLARNEHNETFSFSPITDVKIGDIVYLKSYELNGNTYLADMYIPE